MWLINLLFRKNQCRKGNKNMIEILKLIESIASKELTADNIEKFIALIEKLIALMEAANQKAP